MLFIFNPEESIFESLQYQSVAAALVIILKTYLRTLRIYAFLASISTAIKLISLVSQVYNQTLYNLIFVMDDTGHLTWHA